VRVLNLIGKEKKKKRRKKFGFVEKRLEIRLIGG